LKRIRISTIENGIQQSPIINKPVFYLTSSVNPITYQFSHPTFAIIELFNAIKKRKISEQEAGPSKYPVF
jgi:hypothetical protein